MQDSVIPAYCKLKNTYQNYARCHHLIIGTTFYKSFRIVNTSFYSRLLSHIYLRQPPYQSFKILLLTVGDGDYDDGHLSSCTHLR